MAIKVIAQRRDLKLGSTWATATNILNYQRKIRKIGIIRFIFCIFAPVNHLLRN